MSILTKKQAKTFTANYTEDGVDYILKAEVRHDDECSNGHNTFAITADLYRDKKNGYKTMESCGCLHDEIAKHFPELEPYIKWHLTSTDGPMHYVANTVYHAEGANLKYARSSAVWPDATLEQLLNEDALKERLPALMSAFQSDVESLGLVY